jgi:hypothetical protein
LSLAMLAEAHRLSPRSMIITQLAATFLGSPSGAVPVSRCVSGRSMCRD